MVLLLCVTKHQQQQKASRHDWFGPCPFTLCRSPWSSISVKIVGKKKLNFSRFNAPPNRFSASDLIAILQISMCFFFWALFFVDTNEKNVVSSVFDPAISRFVGLSQKLNACFKSHLKNLTADNKQGIGSSWWQDRDCSSSSIQIDSEKQLVSWRENPSWTEQTPVIKVSIPKGSLCNLKAEVNVGLPPDAVYNIVIDPDNRRVFKNIKEVLSRKVVVDEGLRQVVEVEQAALWRFLWWSGTISVHVLVDQNRADHSMRFKQVKSGFMKRFEGSWKVKPLFVDEDMCDRLKPKTVEEYNGCTGGKGRIGSKVTLDQLIQPAIVPPPPISWYLRGITAKTTEMLINDLLAETARIRGGLAATAGGETEDRDEQRMVKSEDIKERWAKYRRTSRRRRRKDLW